MIQQIISHTPTYVWALLAFLLYRGYQATRDRSSSLLKLALIPGVMLALSLSSINTQGVLGSGVWGVWAVGALIGMALTWQATAGSEIVADRAAGTVLQRGSWVPMILMAGIFSTKYAVAIVSGYHPELHQNLVFAVGVSCLFGAFNGVFLGRLLRYTSAYLGQPVAVAV